MTAPAPGGPDRPARREPAPVLFTEAEKAMVEWEARHDVAAAGRRPSAVSVAGYLAHTRCEDARTTPEQQARTRTPAHARPDRPAPDTRPHVSDLLAWLVAPPAHQQRPAHRGRPGH